MCPSWTYELPHVKRTPCVCVSVSQTTTPSPTPCGWDWEPSVGYVCAPSAQDAREPTDEVLSFWNEKVSCK